MSNSAPGTFQPSGWGVLAVVVAAVCALTLFPAEGVQEGPLIRVTPVGYRGVADAAANLLLFVPAGAAAALVLHGPSRPVLFGAALSLMIELIQLVVPGRYTSVHDLVFNTLGSAGGVALVRRPDIWLRPSRRLARALAALSLAGALLVLAGGAFLFAPAVSELRLHGLWTPAVVGQPQYTGMILDARVGEVAVPHGRVVPTDEVRRLLRNGPEFEVRVQAGRHDGPFTPIFAVYDAAATGQMRVGAERGDLVWRFRMRATALHLDEPELRLRGGLAGIRPGEEYRARGWRQGRGYCLEGAERQVCDLGFTVGDTWSLLLFPVPRLLAAVLSCLWIAALLVPVGYWSHPSLARAGAGLVLMLAALLAAPRLAGILPTPALQLAAAVAGIGAGAAIRMLVGTTPERESVVVSGRSRSSAR